MSNAAPRRAAALLGALVAALAVPALVRADENALDAKGGFRDVKLGIDLDGLKKLDATATVSETRKRGPITFYSRSSDRLSLFGATLASLEYGFKDGKLVAIMMRTETWRQKGGAIDLYDELPEVKRITSGFQDELKGAEKKDLDATKKERIRAFAGDEWKATDVKIHAYEGASISLFVVPMRINLTYPGQFDVRVAVLYLAKGVEVGEI